VSGWHQEFAQRLAKSNFNQPRFPGEDEWSSIKNNDSPKRLAATATKT
jgi:hypothetical protein